MSDEKNPSTEESPETRPEVTGEVRTSDDSASSEARETMEPDAAETATDEDARPEATGEVRVEEAEAVGEPETADTDPANLAESESDATETETTDPGKSEAQPTPESEASGSEPTEDEPDPAAEDEAVDSTQAEGESTVDAAGEETGPDEAATAEEPTAEESAASETPKKKRKRKRKRKRKGAKAPAPDVPVEESPEVAALRKAKEEGTPVEGRVFGWNNGGFHVVVGDVPAFCPRSEMEADGQVAEPESYLDQTLQFLVLRVQEAGRRIVLSRSALEKREHHRQREATLQEISAGTVTKGTVTSVVEFGAFVDLGGVEGLVHRSELTRRRYERIEDVVEVGREVDVKVLKIEKGGRRISLSMKALEPDPWKGVEKRFPEGSVVTAKVEHTAAPGAFIELEPGLTGLLPTSEMNIPREAIPARIFPPGKEVKVVVMSLDPRRRRISLALEGSKPGASHKDLAEFQKSQKKEVEGFGALAAAFAKLGGGED